MTRHFLRRGLAAAGALATWGLAPSVWAGTPTGIIDYGPLSAASSVPTLGEWSLLLLALLVAVVAYRALRGRVNGRLLTHLLLGGGLLAGGLIGGHWVQSVQAKGVATLSMDQAGGGTVEVTDTNVAVPVMNTSGVAQKITGMRLTSESLSWGNPDETPRCDIGVVVQAGATCYVMLEMPE